MPELLYPRWLGAEMHADGRGRTDFYETGRPMSEVVAPHRVENELLRISAKLEAQTEEVVKQARIAAESDVAYKLAWARAMLQVKANDRGSVRKTVGIIEAEVTLAVEGELTNRRISEAVLLGAQEASRNMRSQLEALRSINANVRYQAGLG